MISGKHDFSQKGQSLVELAVSLTFILILLGGVIDLGRAFFAYIALRDAAQEGAAVGSLYPTDFKMVFDRIKQSSNSPIDLANDPGVSMCAKLDDASCSTADQPANLEDACIGHTITVQIAYNFVLSMPFIGGVIGSQSFPITATASNTILSSAPGCPVN